MGGSGETVKISAGVWYCMTQTTRRSDRVVDVVLLPLVLLSVLSLFVAFLPVSGLVLWLIVVPSVVLTAVAVLLIGRAERSSVGLVEYVTDSAE
jgi:hypothetical protein